MVSYTKHNFEFILNQKTEADVAGGSAINVADLVGSLILPYSYGLRALSGAQNNLVYGQNNFGTADNVLPRLLNPEFKPAET